MAKDARAPIQHNEVSAGSAAGARGGAPPVFGTRRTLVRLIEFMARYFERERLRSTIGREPRRVNLSQGGSLVNEHGDRSTNNTVIADPASSRSSQFTSGSCKFPGAGGRPGGSVIARRMNRPALKSPLCDQTYQPRLLLPPQRSRVVRGLSPGTKFRTNDRQTVRIVAVARELHGSSLIIRLPLPVSIFCISSCSDFRRTYR